MPYEYNDIVRQFYEELKPLFVNYLRRNFRLDYDEIMDLYTDVWIDVRGNILCGKVKPWTKRKAYILKMGWNKANKIATRKPQFVSMDEDDVEKFDQVSFEVEKAIRKMEDKPLYEDPDLQAVLAAELGYIPETCNKILKLYYNSGLSMKEIADAMNYSGSRSAIVVKKRCFDKIKARVFDAAHRLGILD